MNTITISMILEDIKRIEDNKKEVAAKYGIQSNKAAEIEQRLLEMANDMRRESGEISNAAFSLFNSCFNIPSSAPKLRKAMENESEEFIKGFMEYIRPQVEKSNRWGRSDSRLTILNKILTERKNSKDDRRSLLIESLQEQTKEFKTKYIDNIVNYEELRFNEFSKYQGMRCWLENEYCYEFGRFFKKVVISSEYTGEVPQNIGSKWVNAFNMIKVESEGWKKGVYLEKVRRDAERDYNYNIEVIADRIIKAGMNTEAVKVGYVGEDAKFFEMFIGDGENRMHCRSIFCAEYSVLVEPHWRFIITNA